MTRLGLIGVGAWGKRYLTTVSQIPSCSITHVVAKTKTRLNSLPNTYKKTIRYQDLLNEKNIDGVVIATPASIHFSIAKDFIKRRIPILVEKPFTTNLKDALTLEKLANHYRGLILVGHEYLYNGAYTKLVQIMPQLGKIRYVYTAAGNYGPIRRDVSCLWDWGPHDVSILTDLFGNLPQSVQAWGIKDDMILFRCNFTHTVTFTHLSRLMPKKTRGIIIVGERKSLVYDELVEKKLTIYDGANVSYPRFSKTPALELEVGEFVNSIRRHKIPKASLSHGVKVIQILDALERSLQNEGRLIALP